jgi:predicted ATP-grasp superfamily ATP-dependent carboligase
LNIPIPATQLVHTVDEALAVATDFNWPLVLKPQQSRIYRDQKTIESFQVSYAINLDDLAEQMREFEGCCSVLLQEYCEGIGYGVELLMWNGDVLSAFQHKRLREVPITGGASSFRESVALDDEMYEYSVKFLKSINWVGLAMVEFKKTNEGPKLMEINGRVWGSIPLAIQSGVDFPAELARAYLKNSEEVDTTLGNNYEVGVRARNLELDIIWMLSVIVGIRRYPYLKTPKRRDVIGAILGLFNPTYKMDMQSWTDLGPGLAEIPNIFKKLWQKFKERNS